MIQPTKISTLIVILMVFLSFGIKSNTVDDYGAYHHKVIEAETFIATEAYDKALMLYEQLFADYEFVFLRECQVAAQLAYFNGQSKLAILYVRRGIRSGWELKSLKKNRLLSELLKDDLWKSLEREYPELRRQYESNLNQDLRKEVKSMFSKDQKKALKALFRFGSKAQVKYAENKFAPHSEEQMAMLSAILETHGYPGERLIGNNVWMSVILSHHNSISTRYNNRDTIYPELRPKIVQAIRDGQITPYEFATIDDWYRSTKYERKRASYGILDPPIDSLLWQTNTLRESIFARPYALRNSLVKIEEKTGMDFYMSDRWY